MRNQPPELFVERLNELLDESEEHGISLEAIARAIGVHRSRLYRWRAGENSPEGARLAGLADYWGVTMDWLWGRPGYPKGEGLSPEQWAARAGRAAAEAGLR